MTADTIPVYALDEHDATAPFMVEYREGRDDSADRTGRVMRPHRHDYYGVSLVKQGSGVHSVDFTEYRIQPGTIIFMSPGQVHHVQRGADADNKNTQGIRIAFTAAFARNHPLLQPGAWETGHLQPGDAAFAQLWDMCMQLFEEYREQQSLGKRIMENYLDIVLSRIYRLLQQGAEQTLQPGSNAKMTRDFRSLVQQHFMEYRQPAAYAAMLHVSAGHLNDVVKAQTGKTASQWIAARVLLEAQRMLVHTHEPVKAIAALLQFNEVSYFYRFFKKLTQQTPEQFREQIREKYT
ncbi:AraC family transcriptional regulator [Deminuibacter soli]|uniref:Helix-turn-helix domain-containing protein n=1 Tax=Deminuibacter soli TaxID=2291815 RepID=A0A3E1NHI2_9BACT|nr:helix-turn-helix domain-containing protein [Deminuibacter soli]RFM27416.1 helix-turn-helix domain-containing protein [Deminuibacter soli]